MSLYTLLMICMSVIKVFTDQSNVNRTMPSKEMKRFAEDFSIPHEFENNDTLEDSLLDCKWFYDNYSTFDDLFCLKDVIMEQSVPKKNVIMNGGITMIRHPFGTSET